MILRIDIKTKVPTFTLIWLVLTLSACVTTAQKDPLSWESAMSRPWQKSEKLDDFVGVHPRYLLNKTKVAELKGKISTTHKQIWGIVKEKADSYTGKSVPSNYSKQNQMRRAGRAVPWMALAYLMTDEAVYLDNAKKWMLTICSYPKWQNNKSLAAGECLFGVSVGYDWLYDKLTEQERSYIREKLVYQAEAMKNGLPVHHDRWTTNHSHVEHSGLAAAGFAVYDEVPQAVEWIRQADLVFRQMFEVRGGDGSSDEGHQYWAYSVENTLCYLEAARELMGKNYYDSPWLKNVADYVIFCTLPGLDPKNYVMSCGDSHRDYAQRNPVYILYRLASEYNNGCAQQLADQMFKRGIGRGDYKTWCNLLWRDEKVQPVVLSTLGTFRHFDDIGWVTMRSGWDGDAVMAGFKCGPMHGHKIHRYYEEQINSGQPYHEISGGHCHPDINSFQIYAFGRWLAIDPGYERPKWTKNHNTILINGVGQLGEGTRWLDRKAVIKNKATSTIIKAESKPDYDYVIGDAGTIYPESAGLKKFYRHFVYVKPGLFLIVDELKAARLSEFEWRLNTEGRIIRESDRYFMIENQDVVMDAHFIYPERLVTSIDGTFLRALSDNAEEVRIITVLHPRRTGSRASTVELQSFRNSVIDLTIQSEGKQVKVQLDLAGQQVRVFEDKK